jgi:hypothetical protein
MSSKIVASFCAQGARDPRGILFRILQLIGPGLSTEPFTGVCRGLGDNSTFVGVLAPCLDTEVSVLGAAAGGRSDPGQRWGTGP